LDPTSHSHCLQALAELCAMLGRRHEAAETLLLAQKIRA
jgi:hypothetical protein